MTLGFDKKKMRGHPHDMLAQSSTNPCYTPFELHITSTAYSASLNHIGKLSTLQHIINLITISLTLTPTSFLKETCLFHYNTRFRVSYVKGCGYASGSTQANDWLTLANLTGKLQTTFFRWKCLNSDWYYIEICFKGVIYNKSALIQLITWCRASDRPLSESMLTQPLTHIYVALWGNVLKENRVSKVRQKSLFAHINKENNMKSANGKYFIG